MRLGTKILHIDDDAGVARAISGLLGQAGYQVTSASNAQDGIRKIKNKQFDLVILDMNMPGMPGSMVLNRLTGDDGRTTVPVLVFSAYAQLVPDDVKEKAAGVLIKPAESETMLAEIDRILDEWQEQ